MLVFATWESREAKNLKAGFVPAGFFGQRAQGGCVGTGWGACSRAPPRHTSPVARTRVGGVQQSCKWSFRWGKLAPQAKILGPFFNPISHNFATAGLSQRAPTFARGGSTRTQTAAGRATAAHGPSRQRGCLVHICSHTSAAATLQPPEAFPTQPADPHQDIQALS